MDCFPVFNLYEKNFLHHFIDFRMHSEKLICISDLSMAPIFSLYPSIQIGFILGVLVMWSILPVGTMFVSWIVESIGTSRRSFYFNARSMSVCLNIYWYCSNFIVWKLVKCIWFNLTVPHTAVFIECNASNKAGLCNGKKTVGYMREMRDDNPLFNKESE